MSENIKAPPATQFRIGDMVRVLHGVDSLALETYYGHLSTHLAFPFTAEHGEEYGHPERVKVIGLGDPHEPMIDEMYGILCEARMEGRVVTVRLGELDNVKGIQNRELIEDYCYWFHNFA